MRAVATLVLLLGMTACSSGSGSDADRSPTDRPSSASAAPVDLAGTEACARVRDGIDAFNVGDLGGTIDEFEAAVPLAEELAREQPSPSTEALLEAVRYYAELPAGDYVEANDSSPEFQRYKAFTLSQCDYTGLPDGATDPAIPA